MRGGVKRLDTLIRELIRELKDLNTKLDKFEVHECKDTPHVVKHCVYLQQVVKELQTDPQAIVDFQCESQQKREAVKKLHKELSEAGTVLMPDMFRINNKIFTDQVFSSVYTSAKPYLQYLAENTSIGTISTSRIYDRIGRRVGVSTTGLDDLNDGVTTLTPPAQTLYIASTSASDTNTGGATGIKQVIVSGILGSGARVNEVVSLNGVTSVATANQYAYLDFLGNYTAGTYGGGAAGTITAKNLAGTLTYAQISTGGWAWRPGCFYTQNNEVGYLHQAYVGAFKAAVRFEIFFGFKGDFGATITPKVATVGNDTGTQLLFPAPMVIPAAGKVLFKGQGETTGAEAYASFFVSVQPPGHN